MKNTLLTLSQAADVLRISENTLNALAFSNQIPHTKIPNLSGNIELYFNSAALVNWFDNLTPINNMNNVMYINKLKERINKHPGSLSILRKYDSQFTHKRKTKGYSLQKVPNKKLGFVYYVRYIDKGNVLPRRSTHTNDYYLACEYAEKMRDILIKDYYRRQEKRPSCRLYNIMKKFYVKDSHYRNTDTRGKPIKDESLKNNQGAINAHWVPFLRSKRITELDSINSGVIIDYQNYCTKKHGLSPQSVNFQVSILNRIFDYLIFNKYIDNNPIKGVPPLYVDTEKMVKVTGCYNVNELKGVFNRRWHDEIHYLLCLLTYTTGMRNCEIKRTRTEDIIKIKTCYFIDIKDSKTKNSIRKVPLHNFVYNKLKAYIKKHNKEKDEYLFCQRRGKLTPIYWFTDAYIELGKHLNYTPEQLKKENIAFYSGRHFWKTLMNANGLGEDIEEVFMGHKVSADVKKRYNHRDKQGQAVIIKKANEVFKILDEALFNNTRKTIKPVRKTIRKKRPARKSVRTRSAS